MSDISESLGKLTVSEDLKNGSINVVITYPKDSYIYQPLIESSEKYLKPTRIYNSLSDIPKNDQKNGGGDGKIFHFGEYEELDMDKMMSNSSYLTNSYIYRKALIRKHYLSNTINIHTSKNPGSILKKAFPDSFQFELDYAEFLDDVLDEVYELRCELEENESNGCPKTFILKPSMSDKGQGIRLFKTIDQLQEIFNSFEEDYNSDDEEEPNGSDNNNIITSQLRHFIVQEYISKPLLLKEYENRKFHIRTYVVSKGSIEVFVYKRMLMLFSENSYHDPHSSNEDSEIDMSGHLTNTCLQHETEKTVVIEFDKSAIDEESKLKIHEQINEITGELFKAACTVDKINFQPLSNSFEIFGLDFMVDKDLNVSLLEVNSYPDFKQTGDDLKDLIYELFDDVVYQCVDTYFNKDKPVTIPKNLFKVLDYNTNSWS
ncbi:hypothetical protein BVG19_g4825 [[Candida] boidinii]|nr:hypothetical protein BVG19_g4825 [[Candida] boidinii]OWB51668.1 hypothetical protein B5S27_g3233 [[Candida] boidinii]